MIKDFEEYKVYRSKLLTKGISSEEAAKIDKKMDEFLRTHPEIFRKMSEAKWVGSLTDPQ